MNYKKLYIDIISKAKSENRKKGHGVYYENHHILPKSLFPLWKTKKSNLVLLTAREHFFCHQLLTKIYPSKAMSYALFRLATDNNHRVTSREYERIKAMSSRKFASFYGKHQSLEVKEKIRLSKLGKNNPNYGKHWFTNGKINICAKECPQGFYSGRITDNEFNKKCGHKKNIGKHVYNNGFTNIFAFECPEGFTKGSLYSPNKGRTFDEKVRANMSNAHKGKILLEEHKRKISESGIGKKHRPPKYKKTYTMTEDHKKKLSEIRKNKNLHWYTNGVESIQCDKCPEGFWPGRKIK